MKERIYLPECPQHLPRSELQIDYGDEYPNDIVYGELQRMLASQLGLPVDKIPGMTEPPKQIKADFGLPLFTLAKELKQNPVVIAQGLVDTLTFPEKSMIYEIEASGPYLNLHLDFERYGQEVLTQVLQRKDSFGAENIGQGETVVVDMSSPNIAKPMSVGHLRSTVIGHSIARIFEFTDHNVIKDNHLGDWGAQLGMLLKAYELWGDETPEFEQPGKEVDGLLSLYVRIHEEVDRAKQGKVEQIKQLVAEKGLSAIEGLEQAYQRELADCGSPDQALVQALSRFIPETELEKAGREWFRRLEQGDKEAKRQWEWVIGLSMKEFETVYKLLGVDFDYALGESFYSKMLTDIVEEVKQQAFTAIENGAVVAHLEDKDLGKMVIQTKDGRSLYVTRDLATAIFRSEIFKADRLLYVVGGEQKLYFQQWFEILRRMGYPIADKCQHIYFGMITLPEGRMSTRRGRVIFLKDVIEEGVNRAAEAIKNKNSELFADSERCQEVARQVAVGAIIWSDIGKDMRRDIAFSWDEMLSFDGYSAPYVQYAYARGVGILRKGVGEGINIRQEGKLTFTTDFERKLVRRLAVFPEAVKVASANCNPATIAEYVHQLAQDFNQFYRECPVLKEGNEDVRQTRFKITEATTQVIKNALYLLGIEAPQEM